MDASEEKALRAAIEEIGRYRREWADRLRQEIEAEVAELEAAGFDPTRGRGRGPKWMEGA